ncbi:hypothetical protein DM01DRAFT_1334610 [Hesseltinella vesiculosa]|uniref:protein kinase C n=1 Tax=Hesseltinella vesiculosa TaxID=101127 RepID=A0A1X2GMG5_9FUNG|nr:hypothetical protein DM01DRAFT_1334610 [Hesseltinella vesiculosa]
MEDVRLQVKELTAKLQQVIQVREKAIEIRAMLTDRNAQDQCDALINEHQRYIDYFTRELQQRRFRLSRSSTQPILSMERTDSPPPVPPHLTPSTLDNSEIHVDPSQYPWIHTDISSPSLPTSPTSLTVDLVSPLPTQSFFPNDPGYPDSPLLAPNGSHTKKRFTNLDLLKADTPIHPAKVSLKLHELEYKVDVEQKVQIGIRNLFQSIQPHGSGPERRLLKQELQKKQEESHAKMSLLSTAVKKYKSLYFGEEDPNIHEVDSDDDTNQQTRALPGLRRPVSGKLQLKITEACDLAHAPTRYFKMRRQTAVMINIDGNTQCHTKSSKTDKWTDSFELNVDKAAEVELIIYDRSGDKTLPIGLLWLKISDIAESLRKQKINQDQQDTHWMLADDIVAQQHTYPQSSPLPQPPSLSFVSNDSAHTNSASPSTSATTHSHHGGRASPLASHMQSVPNLVDSHRQPSLTTHNSIIAWFDVEPVGRIYLDIAFVRETGKRRPMDKLGRAGAVRERKGEVHEMNGHQFLTRRFYHIMKCALCGDFMTNLNCQCQNCGMACHKRCYPNVVTKCASPTLPSKGDDVDTLRHRIPHRFETLTVISAHWCCHCGSMLTIGFRGAQKCTECDTVCHTKCMQKVPDFCGMTMEKANLMLSEMRAASHRRSQLLEMPTLGQSTYGGLASISQPHIPRDDSFYHNAHASSAEISLPSYLSSSNLRSSSPRQTNPPMRPFSVSLESPSYQSLSAIFGGNSNENSVSRRHSQSVFARVTPVQLSRRVGLDDFNLLAVLGKGNFGKVMLAEEKYTNELYAIKVLKKRFVLDNDEVDSTRSEKRVFLIANQEQHPFLVKLHSTFTTQTRIYFVMEYISGGDLMMHIQREPFSENRARFYASEVLLALEHFHKHGIIYRDLKLDNIMLCMDGHIKLADYGLCKENMWLNNTTNTFCGTPEFMAPEILLEQRYGRAVDWWAFGVLIYEMLLGQCPFRGEDEDEIFDAVLEDDILYPRTMSGDCVSICQRLLERNPARRLGSGKGDGQEVRQHPFFASVHWDDLLAKKVTPPFLPSVVSRADTSNFDEEFTREIPILTPVNAMLSDAEQQEFADFSFVADWAIQ